MINQKIQILDSTLREGEQTPGVSFSISQKIEILKMLNSFGVDFIEIGHPVVSTDIYSFIKNISKMKLRSKVIAHSRLLKKDIDNVIELNIPWVGLFFDICERHLEKKYGIDEEKAISIITESIAYAKKNKLKVRFTIEDASRASYESMIKIAKIVEDSGADRLSIADTIGILHPLKVSDIFSRITSEVNIPIHGHFHNDFGLATANALQAFQSGATCVDVTVNGLGERCGISSLAEVTTSLDELFNVKNSWNFKMLNDICSFVEHISEIKDNDTRPITGKNAFTHKAGLHVSSMIKDPTMYEAANPAKFNRERRFTIDKFSGKDALNYRMKKLSIQISEEEIKQLLNIIKSKPEIKSWSDEKLVLLYQKFHNDRNLQIIEK